MAATESVATLGKTGQPVVSVIVPARNEEANLGQCLESLVSQTGVEFEIIVVDDHSTDRTREIAGAFPNVRVVEAGPLPEGWTGKNNAVTTGVRQAKGQWLLFTDADTVHLPGSLACSLKEASDKGVDMLSFSPQQIAVTFWEKATLPVVFSELARQYPLAKVSDPNSPDAAANGQYILIRRAVYESVGGHAAIAGDILEDVALAQAVKRSGHKILFRYGADAVRTRMYRNYAQLRDGWTKNLALLFPNPGWLATKTLVQWVFPWVILAFAVAGVLPESWWITLLVGSFLFLTMRLRRANFTSDMMLLGPLFGMPMFAYLLIRSKCAHASGNIQWKDRTYSDKGPSASRASHSATSSSTKNASLLQMPH